MLQMAHGTPMKAHGRPKVMLSAHGRPTVLLLRAHGIPTVLQLRALCAEHGLHKAGVKAALVARLCDALCSAEPGGEAAEDAAGFFKKEQRQLRCVIGLARHLVLPFRC